MLVPWILTIAIGASAVAQEPASPALGHAFEPGARAVWVFEVDGARIGHHASRYVGPISVRGVEAHHFHGELSLAMAALGDVELRSTADLWTDGAGHPLRFVQHALVGEGYSRVELEVAADSAQARIVQGPSTREIAPKVDSAAFLLANNFVSHLEILLATLPPGADAETKLFSANALQSIPYRLKLEGPYEDARDGVKVAGHAYSDSLGEKLVFAGGRLLRVEIPAQKIVIRRSDEDVEPIAIEPPEVERASARFDVEDVRIEREGAVIAGMVTKRKGATGRLPAVFFVSGSGPQDRHGYSSGLDLGTHELLDRLTNDGFLVLRVDDRSAGESSALPPNATFLDLLADARACVDHLSKRADVDPARIALIGHSEGGQSVPILAVERPEIAAIVLMAAPGRSILAIIADQNRLALEEAGLAPEEIEKKMPEVVALLARLASDEPMDEADLPDEVRASLSSRAWLKSHAQQDPIANVKRVRCPVLILQGAKDFQVSLERDARALAAALDEVEHGDHELRAFPDLDHLFKKTPGETSQLSDYWKRRPVDPGFLDALSTWLRARLLAGEH